MSRYYRVQQHRAERVDFSALDVLHSLMPGRGRLQIQRRKSDPESLLLWDHVEDEFYDKLPDLRDFVMYGRERDGFVSGQWNLLVQLLLRHLEDST